MHDSVDRNAAGARQEAPAKALGAYYTDAQVAEFLVSWAVRSATDQVMDPSFGGGVFLRAACQRLVELGGSPGRQVFGVEIDSPVYNQISERLCDEFGVRRHHLHRLDFFSCEAEAAQVDAVVGNPPFIRYQRFSGEARQRALECAQRRGVRLSELCSSWAPFVVHSVAAIRAGGRLAMVVPAEIGYAVYARAVLAYLQASFHTVTLATFRKRLFPDLSEDTYLLLADGKGSGPARFLLRDFAHAGELAKARKLRSGLLQRTTPIPASSLLGAEGRLAESFLSAKERALYRELKLDTRTASLGEVADVGIGYVTGANSFFHLARNAARTWSIPARFLRPAVCRGKALVGLRLTQSDWSGTVSEGERGYLLQIDSDEVVPDTVRRYLKEGERLGVHRGYKCRTREPWYRVPHVYLPDAFLTYMSGAAPRLVANEAMAVAPNTLHVVRLHPQAPLTSNGLAAVWQTALARLSSEVEGHSLGGGMLKLEPTEAERVTIPLVPEGHDLSSVIEELDGLLRTRREEEAGRVADRRILKDQLGLSASDCKLLRSASLRLKERRYARGAAA